MANVWFTSDLHLGHKNIHNFRTQFESELHHREVIKENYHKVVTKRDKVYFLGDVAFTQETLEDVGTWVAEKKVLMLVIIVLTTSRCQRSANTLMKCTV